MNETQIHDTLIVVDRPIIAKNGEDKTIPDSAARRHMYTQILNTTKSNLHLMI